MRRSIIAIAVILFIVVLLIPDSQGIPRGFFEKNKIYTSVYDQSLVIIAPNDNVSLRIKATYEGYLFCPEPVNVTVYYNGLSLKSKSPNETAVIFHFLANDSSFQIIAKKGMDSLKYIIIDYTAQGGYPQGDSDEDTMPDNIDPYPFDFNNDGIPDSETVGRRGDTYGPDADGDGLTDYPDGIDMWLNTTIPDTPLFPLEYRNKQISLYIGEYVPPGPSIPSAAPLTRAQVTDLTLKALLAIFIIIPLVVFWVKRIKEHSTTAGTLGMADNYYRSPDDGEKE